MILTRKTKIICNIVRPPCPGNLKRLPSCLVSTGPMAFIQGCPCTSRIILRYFRRYSKSLFAHTRQESCLKYLHIPTRLKTCTEQLEAFYLDLSGDISRRVWAPAVRRLSVFISRLRTHLLSAVHFWRRRWWWWWKLEFHRRIAVVSCGLYTPSKTFFLALIRLAMFHIVLGWRWRRWWRN